MSRTNCASKVSEHGLESVSCTGSQGVSSAELLGLFLYKAGRRLLEKVVARCLLEGLLFWCFACEEGHKIACLYGSLCIPSSVRPYYGRLRRHASINMCRGKAAKRCSLGVATSLCAVFALVSRPFLLHCALLQRGTYYTYEDTTRVLNIIAVIFYSL